MVATVLALCVLSVFSPMGSVLWGDRRLEVYLLRLVPDDGRQDELLVSKKVSDQFNAQEIGQLKALGLKGRVESLGMYAANTYPYSWPRAKAIVIFTSSVTEDLSVLQPKYTSIFYVQEGGVFSKHPSDASTIDRKILFGKSGENVQIDTFSRGRSGFAADINRGLGASRK